MADDLRRAYIPQLVDFTPTDTTTSVASLPTLEMTFSMQMHVYSLMSGDVDALNNYLNQYIALTDDTSNQPVAVEYVSYDPGDILKVMPTSALTPGAKYRVMLKIGFSASSGRGTDRDYSWTFTVEESDVEQTQLVSPANETVVAASPSYSWSAVTGDNVTYDLNVSAYQNFQTLVYAATGLASASLSALSTAIIQDDHTYFWRVRGVSGEVYGKWSDVWAFTVEVPGTDAVIPTPTSLFDTFSLTSFYLSGGDSNLSTWPVPILSFSHSVDEASIESGIAVTAEDVDTGETLTAPTYGVSVSANVVTIVFDGTPEENTKYTISVIQVESTSGVATSEIQQITFTGAYLPLYTTASALLATDPGLLSKYSTDEINLQLHRSSLRANKILYINLDPDDPELGVIDTGPTMATLRTSRTHTWALQNYVEKHATYSLVQALLHEKLRDIGKRSVDSLTTDIDETIIPNMTKLLKDLEIQVRAAESEMFSGGEKADPRVGVRNSRWNPINLNYDWSTSHIQRRNI